MHYLTRKLPPFILESLKVSPVVFVNGPRQAGKSTLVQRLAQKDFPAEYISFDSATQMAAAASAPIEFLQSRKQALIINEVQMVPEIFRGLKIVVDEVRQKNKNKANGQFLLTGSANILALPKLSDPLVGRMSVLTLYPFSAVEVFRGKGNFIDRLFNSDFKNTSTKKQSIETVISRATFPEISGMPLRNRNIWFDGYLTTILQRDVRVLAELEKLTILPHLLSILAARAGSLINDADVARSAGLNAVTGKNYRTILKMMYLTFDIQPWFRNIGKRLVKSRKGYFVDTLLLCHLMDIELDGLRMRRPELFGHVLENFVASELLKLLSFSKSRAQLFHFRTSDGKEVDFVLENPDGKIAAIEVKTGEIVDVRDFKGMKELGKHTGDNFACGILLYSGYDIVPFGNRYWAVPLTTLWE